MSRYNNFSKKELEDVVQNNTSWNNILLALDGYNSHNKMVPFLKERLDELEIDYSHLNPEKTKEKIHKGNQNKHFSDEEIFQKNSGFSSNTVRKRFFKLTKESNYKCAICGQKPFWNGKPLVLTMDHIDGNNKNHSFDNLRWVCPNCDRQLDSYGNKCSRGENGELIKEKAPQKILCPICQKKLMWKKSSMCKECRRKEEQISGRGRHFEVSREDLKSLIRTNSFVAVRNKLGVSDSAIIKRCKYLKLPYKRTVINSYSEEEWEKV